MKHVFFYFAVILITIGYIIINVIRIFFQFLWSFKKPRFFLKFTYEYRYSTDITTYKSFIHCLVDPKYKHHLFNN
jgi:hypothetical protein